MQKLFFAEFQRMLDGKSSATAIRILARQTKSRLETGINRKRMEKDGEIKRILKFCHYLEDTLELPPGLSKEEWRFYRRTMEKLVNGKIMPRYVLDVFEEPL